MHHTKKNLLLAAVLSTGLSACVSTPDTKEPTIETAATPSSPSATREQSSGSTTTNPDKKMAQAMAFSALREYLNDERSSIRVIDMRALNWPDASLGCPRPGLNYPQVMIPGYKAQLESSGKTYDVHVAKQRAFVCDDDMKAAAGKPQKMVKSGDLIIERMSNLAKKDLASKLGVAEASIKVLASRPVTWPNEKLGCENDAPAVPLNKALNRGVDGYRFVLASKGRQFIYHSDEEARVLACPKIEDA